MSERLQCAAVFVGLFCLYGALGCRTAYWNDSAEFVYVAETRGIAHPPGYPLYALVTAAVAQLPLSTAHSLSILSAAFGAAAMAWTFLALRRLDVDGAAAAAASVFVGLGASLVDQATIPEVYALHLLLNVIVVERVLAWRVSRSPRHIAGGAFALGLAFSNHLTTTWLGPPLAVLLWSERAALRAVWLRAAGCVVLGLLPWLYLPALAASDPLYNQGDPSTPERFIALVTGEIFRHKLLTLSPGEILGETRLYARSLLSQWTAWALLALPLGIVVIARRVPRVVALAGLLWWLGGVAFIANYSIVDKEGYYLVPHALVGLAVAAGAGRAVWWIRSRTPSAAILRPEILSWCLALVPLAWTFRASRADNTSLVDYTTDLWRNLPQRSLLLTEDLNLHYGTLLLQRDGTLPADAAVVSQYLLGFRWYQQFLRERYPDLELPPSLEPRTARFEEVAERVSGPELASRRGRIVEQMAHDVVAANLARRPVALLPLETGAEHAQYGPFHLRNSGIAFVVQERPNEPEDGTIELSEKYLIGKASFRDAGERFVAERYALAMHRFGRRLLERRDYEAAADAFERAARYDRRQLAGLHDLGLVLVQYLGRVEEGRKVWQEYAEIAGDEADERILEYLRR